MTQPCVFVARGQVEPPQAAYGCPMQPPIRLDPRKTALVIVDMQNDFCHPDGFFARVGQDVSGCAAIVPAIERLLARCREAGAWVVFTLTEHTPGSTEPERHRILPER